MKKIIILPLMLFALSAPTMAEETPIDEMFRVMSMDKQMMGGFEAMLPIIDQMSSKFQLDSKGEEELKDIFRAWFTEDIDRLKIMKEVKALYTQSFTDSDITSITKFYQTNVGKKFIEKSAQLMQLGAQIGMKEAQEKQIKLMERIQPFLEKHNIKQ